ncbi:type II secretion system F family protein [Nitriliruptor alkaliphilus]|uniref:type II secretion system F family protein n=1 Tax=Nitriliruptor alkaliphilus TaxID=427918 RepID=UPI0006985645|nr:type II secretion system F family protein [Nitriliruptor alkaliphilus]
MVSIGLLAGALTAASAALAVVALVPRPAALSERIRTALSTAPSVDERGRSRLVRVQQRLTPVDDRLAADLAVTGTTIERLLIRRLLWAATGAVVPVLFWPAGLAALGAPLAAAPAVGLAGGAAGWWLAMYETRDQAVKRRRELSLALAAYLQLTATMIRAGTAEEQALRDAAAAGSGWSFTALERALERAVQSGSSIWQTFDELGAQLGMVELRALAAELRIASRQGSSPARALTARAASLRDEELATQLTAANRAEKQMAAPLVGLGLCVVIFIIFPALATFIGT